MGWGKDNGKERQGEIYRGGSNGVKEWGGGRTGKERQGEIYRGRSSGDLIGVGERQLQGET